MPYVLLHKLRYLLSVKGTFDMQILELSQYLLRISDRVSYNDRSKWVPSRAAVTMSQKRLSNAMIFLNGACLTLHADCYSSCALYAQRKEARKRAL